MHSVASTTCKAISLYTGSVTDVCGEDKKYGPLKAVLQKHQIGPLFVYELKNVTDRVVQEWPPEQFVYVGIDHSPGPVIAEIQARYGPSAARNMPLFDFRYLKAGKVKGTVRERSRRKLTAPQRSRLFQHFDMFLDGLPPDKKVLLIDYAYSGQALLSVTRECKLYLRDKGQEFLPSYEHPGIEERRLHALGICDQLVDAARLADCGVNILQAFQRSGSLDPELAHYGKTFEVALEQSNGKRLAAYNPYDQKVTMGFLMENAQPLFKLNPNYRLLVELLGSTGRPTVPAEMPDHWELHRAAV